MELTTAQINRARGMVLGAAVGDALGAGYEYEAFEKDLVPEMVGGGLGDFEPGEWTDDTSQTWIVAKVAAKHKTFFGKKPMDMLAKELRTWFLSNPPDIGGTTAYAIGGAGKDPNAARMMKSAERVKGITNGSLMRTSPVVLPYLTNPKSLVSAAREVSQLTHWSPEAAGACTAWSLILRHAVMTGELNIDEPFKLLYQPQNKFWRTVTQKAVATDPFEFAPNSEAVSALQAALSSITHTKNHDFRQSLYTAVRVGCDTDTVASIAGALVGALNGIDAIPEEWLTMLHGYPGKTGQDLDNLVLDALE